VDDERVVWPMETITFTKPELFSLVLPILDAAIELLDVSMVQSDLIEIRSMILDRLEGVT
jgi:hypothetical protein